ncbi:MAG TPA: FeS-binding protein [Spirochaetota bacterium]|nr:FeS-binding protein [Spirochaetota bacterium]
MDKPDNRNLKYIQWTAIASVMALAVTGFGQMPLYKRYYLGSMPGLGWTADYYITHNIHYISAVILLGLAAYYITKYFLQNRDAFTITRQGRVIHIFLAGIIITGIFKVIASQRGVYFSEGLLFILDLLHILFAFMFLVSAGIFKIMKYRRYEKILK